MSVNFLFSFCVIENGIEEIRMVYCEGKWRIGDKLKVVHRWNVGENPAVSTLTRPPVVLFIIA